MIKQIFEQYFSNWNIALPDDHLKNRLGGSISKAGWNIRYVFGEENGKGYIEFYATHRMTDDRHCKIYEDGKVVELDAISSMVFYNPQISGDEERKSRENREYNNRVYKELQEKGLDIMTINTYLSLNKVEKQ